MVLSCVVLLVVTLTLHSVAFSDEGKSSFRSKLPGTYQYLDIYDDVENDSTTSKSTGESKCPPQLQIGNLRVEDDVYKLDLKEDLQFSNESCNFYPGFDGDMSLVNISTYGTSVPAEGNAPPDNYSFWEGSLHDSTGNGVHVMSCEKMGPVANVDVHVVKTADILESVFVLINLVDLFHEKSDALLQTFGEEAVISVMFDSKMCAFLSQNLAQFFTQLAEGREIGQFPFSDEGAEYSENSTQSKDSQPELATWLPGKYWSFNFTEKFDIKQISMFGPNCPPYLTVKRVAAEKGGFQIDLQNDLILGEEKCAFDSQARHRTITLKSSSNAEAYDDNTQIPEAEFSESFKSRQDSNQSYGKPMYLVGYLPTVPVKDFMTCTKLGPLSSISLSITDQNPYAQYLELESAKGPDSSSGVADVNLMISVGFGNKACMYLKQEDVELLKKLTGDYSYVHSDDEYGHYPREKVENLSFSQICPCQSSFPKDYESKGKTEFLIEEFRKSYQGYQESYSQPQGNNIMTFEDSDFCAKNASFGVADLINAWNGTTSTAKILLRGAVDQIYDDLFYNSPPPFGIMLQHIWNEGHYQTKIRRIIMQRKGLDCETSPLVNDSVLLIEFRHTLNQMSERAIMKDLNKTKIYELLYTERRSQGFTMHMFQANHDGSLLKCTYTSSKLAKTLLSPQCKAQGNFGRVLGTSDVGHHDGSTNQTSKNEMVSTSPTITPDSSMFASISPSPKLPLVISDPPPIVPSSVTPSPSPSPSISASKSSLISPSPSLTSTSSGVACFPGTAKVALEDGPLLAMGELKVGQRVRDATGKFSTVLLFAHSNRDVASEFVHVQSAKGDIALSPTHYIYANNKLVIAEHVRVGDQISILDLNHTAQVSWTSVLKVSRVLERGLFNPQTTSGSIAVYWQGNAVMASTYTAALHPKLAHSLLGSLRWLDSKLGLTIPMLSSFLIDGSPAWAWLLPSGSALYEL